MYIKIYNKSNPVETMIVTELSDYLFQEGWRFGEVISSMSGEQLWQCDEDLRCISVTQRGY